MIKNNISLYKFLFQFGLGKKETKKQVAKIRILFGLRNILIRPDKPNPGINGLNNGIVNNGIVDMVSLI